jgi:large subunit ribosomal protein L6
MSRIGRKEIEIPAGVKVTINGNHVGVSGKLGKLERELHERVSIEQEGNILRVKRASDNKFDRSLHGLSRTLVNNMIVGVNEGYSKLMAVQGVGYRAEVKPDKLIFHVGYSHPVEVILPQGIKAEEAEKNVVKISGIDKEQVGQVSANLRAIRPPDSYKGKGIRYKDERVKLKPGKSGV